MARLNSQSMFGNNSSFGGPTDFESSYFIGYSALSPRIGHFMATKLCNDVCSNFTFFVKETTGTLVRHHWGRVTYV
jgi:hypothetical protein